VPQEVTYGRSKTQATAIHELLAESAIKKTQEQLNQSQMFTTADKWQTTRAICVLNFST
jgi:hypothetical protein